MPAPQVRASQVPAPRPAPPHAEPLTSEPGRISHPRRCEPLRNPSVTLASMNTDIISLSTPLEPDLSSPAADRLIEGTPQHGVANYFADPTNQFFIGRWSSTKGTWRVRYTEHELCVITAGKVLIKK